MEVVVIVRFLFCVGFFQLCVKAFVIRLTSTEFTALTFVPTNTNVEGGKFLVGSELNGVLLEVVVNENVFVFFLTIFFFFFKS